MIHVARRFGALEKWVDFSTVSLRSLIKSFEGTVIYSEALKEIFTKDLDFNSLMVVLERIGKGEIGLLALETNGVATPIAKLGLERVSMKTDLIPPERMMHILIETTKARLLSQVTTLLCTNCWDYAEEIAVKELPDRPSCPRCGSSKMGMLLVEEGKTHPLIDKKNGKLSRKERSLKNRARTTATLVSKYGKLAALVLASGKIGVGEAKKILLENNEFSNRFFESIINAEQNALKRMFR
jgi:ATP-dependent Lhr-like helicase